MPYGRPRVLLHAARHGWVCVDLVDLDTAIDDAVVDAAEIDVGDGKGPGKNLPVRIVAHIGDFLGDRTFRDAIRVIALDRPVVLDDILFDNPCLVALYVMRQDLTADVEGAVLAKKAILSPFGGVADCDAAPRWQVAVRQRLHRAIILVVAPDQVRLGTAIAVLGAYERRISSRTGTRLHANGCEVIDACLVQSDQQRKALERSQRVIEDPGLRRNLCQLDAKACRAFEFEACQPVEIGEDIMADRSRTLEEQLFISERLQYFRSLRHGSQKMPHRRGKPLGRHVIDHLLPRPGLPSVYFRLSSDRATLCLRLARNRRGRNRRGSYGINRLHGL